MAVDAVSASIQAVFYPITVAIEALFDSVSQIGNCRSAKQSAAESDGEDGLMHGDLYYC
ncbi:MAG: hypothetical protein ACR2PZ_06090 [Pseudomonadales bacterium]